ncbi:hypothetical protein RB195_011588 [Necator americanus]|uniref:Uncharacterized protein n=1 Tax=Necator americanus TaxID=51031 RepID=A0ABR1D3Z9_NECAM
MHPQLSDLVDWKRHKSLASCKSTIAFALRFIKGVSSRVNADLRQRIEKIIPEISQMTTEPYVTAKEREMASKVLVKNHQRVHVTDPRKRVLKQLKLHLDESGILRRRDALKKQI